MVAETFDTRKKFYETRKWIFVIRCNIVQKHAHGTFFFGMEYKRKKGT